MLRKTTLARSLTLAFGATALTIGMSSTVLAQSNATGNVFGQVEAATGASVVIENAGTKQRRAVTLDASGRYSVTALPPGKYTVQLVRDGKVTTTQEIEVLIGQGAEASFVAPGVQTVQVVGRRKTIDVSNTNNSVTFTAAQLSKLPTQQNVGSIIQLAPNTTTADSRYAGGASFGGGGASENAYYINGFPVTNPLTQLGASELPFGAIAQAQVLTGGFGAEFGRSIGGVVNITTKSGTNRWEIGGTFSVTPSSLSSAQKDIFYPKTGAAENAATDGTLYRKRSDNQTSAQRKGVYFGGPLIEDKLFLFAAVEQTNTDFSGTNASFGLRTSTSAPTKGWQESTNSTTRYMTKLDWNLSDNHRMEYTLIGDNPSSDKYLYGYDYATNTRNNVKASGEHYKNFDNETDQGGIASILKYTGNLTENLTLTALYGKSKVEHVNEFDGFDPTKKLYQVVAASANRVPGLTYNNPNPLVGNILPLGAEDTVTSKRLDLEYKLGNHTLRAGLDDNKLASTNAGNALAGGGSWTYLKTSTPNTPITLQNVKAATASGGGYGVDGYYVRETIFDDATSAYSNQSAQYIEDRYQVTKNLLLVAGLRSESFSNLNGDHVAFLEMKNQLAPRFAASWDVNGDASLKTFGSLGRYHVQIPTHLAVRGASRSLFTRQSFTYTGVDANGAPTGLVKLVPTPFSSNNEYGQAKDALTVSAVDMKPTYQDELTLGFEKAYSPSLNFGAKVTYRDMKTTIDDLCDDRAFNMWLDAHPTVDASNWGGFGCASFNPGMDNKFLVDFSGTGKNHTLVTLTKEMLGMPKAQRTYTAVDLFLEHPMRSGWYGKVNYTWSRSKGNTEGQTLSDVAQTDVAATQTWDVKEIMEYKNGLLPNDRTHQIKAFGFYELTPEVTVGANLLLASGRPTNCIGNHPTVDPSYDYGSAYAYCDGKPSPRGTTGNLPWQKRLDANLAYRPAAFKGITLRLDVFNVTNTQTAQTIDEVYNSGSAVSPTYGRVISYTSPRSVKLGVDFAHQF